MERLKSTINSLLAVMQEPNGDGDIPCRHKAEVIVHFAEEVSKEILRKAGLPEEMRDANMLVFVLDDLPEYTPGSGWGNIFLLNVPSDLSWKESDEGYPLVAHNLVFMCDGRVLDWDEKNHRPRKTMSYEDAARLVVLWLEEKILQILRKNRWDKVKDVVDIYDRMSHFFNEAA